LADCNTTHYLAADPTMVEVWAALHAVIFSKEVGLFDILLEGDALQIVNESNTDMQNTSKYGHLGEGIRT
jgi:hypothetical protein